MILTDIPLCNYCWHSEHDGQCVADECECPGSPVGAS